MNKFNFLTAAAVGGFLSAATLQAQAVSINVLFTDEDAGISQVVSGTDGVVFNGSVGEWDIDFEVTSADFIAFGFSELVQTEMDAASDGAGRLTVKLVATDFAGGASAPSQSSVGFTMQGNGLGGSITGQGHVNDSNAGLDAGPPVVFPQEVQIGSDLSFVEEDFSPFSPSWEDSTTSGAVLNAPFSMSMYFDIIHDGDDFSVVDDRTVFQATASAVVPVPAALPLFASALLGLGLLGRRRARA